MLLGSQLNIVVYFRLLICYDNIRVTYLELYILFNSNFVKNNNVIITTNTSDLFTHHLSKGGVSHYKYLRQFAGNILNLKRFSIKLTTILVFPYSPATCLKYNKFIGGIPLQHDRKLFMVTSIFGKLPEKL